MSKPSTPLLTALLLSMLMAGCGSPSPDTPPGDPNPLDQSSPAATVETMIRAARLGQARHLSSLCHPAWETGTDVRRICELADSVLVSSGFVHSFRQAQLLPPCGEGEGRVTLIYSPDNRQCGEILLRQEAGRWFLVELH